MPVFFQYWWVTTATGIPLPGCSSSGKKASPGHLYPKGGEVIGLNKIGADAPGNLTFGQAHRLQVVGHQMGEDLIPFAQVLVVRIGELMVAARLLFISEGHYRIHLHRLSRRYVTREQGDRG